MQTYPVYTNCYSVPFTANLRIKIGPCSCKRERAVFLDTEPPTIQIEAINLCSAISLQTSHKWIDDMHGSYSLAFQMMI